MNDSKQLVGAHSSCPALSILSRNAAKRRTVSVAGQSLLPLANDLDSQNTTGQVARTCSAFPFGAPSSDTSSTVVESCKLGGLPDDLLNLVKGRSNEWEERDIKEPEKVGKAQQLASSPARVHRRTTRVLNC